MIVPRDAALLARRWQVGDEFIVEWRALTVALLDELAPRVRKLLGRSEAELPLACVLEGGTWAAGRALAQRLRDGAPPLRDRQRRHGVLGGSRPLMHDNVHLVDHPLVQHKLTLMRRKDASTNSFRRLLNEISVLMAYEVMRDMPMQESRSRRRSRPCARR